MIKRFITTLMVIAATTACTKKNSATTGTDASPAGQAAAQEIHIGEFGSYTGTEATFGTSTHRGVEMALDEVNKAGGVKGRRIKLTWYDNQGKPDEAAAVVTRLITKDKVVAVIGEVASSRSLAAAPIAQQYKVPLISPASTNPKVTEIGDYVFRVCFIDPFQGTVMAKFASDTLKAKRVAVLRDVKSDYSVGLANFFTKKFKELGGEIVADQSYQNGDVDFKGQLTQIRGTKPDAIFIPGYYTEVGLIARQARQLGIKAPLLGGDGWDSPKLHEIGGEAINGNYFSNHYTTETTEPIVLDFIKKYKERYNEVPDAMAALGYDATRVLINSLERATTIEPKAIREAIAQTKDFQGVTGKITINQERNADKGAVVVKVDGNVNRFVTTVTP